jgi:hypothetical protein
MTLEEISSRLEIEQVLYRYCRGVDRGDRAMISSVYHPGAQDAHGPWEGEGKDFADFLVPAMDAVNLIGQHHITNKLIEVRGTEARAESYFFAFHAIADGPRHVFIGGRYLDQFERREGNWKIADRRVLIDISYVIPAEAPWRGAADFPVGARRGGDPSAGLFAPPR